jgi:hypothetical protein
MPSVTYWQKAVDHSNPNQKKIWKKTQGLKSYQHVPQVKYFEKLVIKLGLGQDLIH